MPARIQSLIIGLGSAKQADIATAGTSFIRMKKLNSEITSPSPINEDDADEIGKGHEFATQTFPSHFNVSGTIEKYCSAEFATWACAYGLGNIVQTGTTPNYVYTMTPIDLGTSLELPYFTLVEQVPEGGSNCIDNKFIGCAVDSFTYSFGSGPGHANSKMSVNWIGSGKLLSPSAVTVPALTTEHQLPSGSMTLSVNGVDYVGAKTIIGGSISWNNSLNADGGFFPGSGTQSGYQIRGRLEVGKRMPSFQYTVRLKASSTEYATLLAQSTGTTTLTTTYDANNSLSFTFQKTAFRAVTNTEANGIVAVTVTADPEYDNTNGILTVVAKCGITGIAQ